MHNLDLQKGLNVIQGKVVYKAVADAFNLVYSDVKEFLGLTERFRAGPHRLGD